MLPAGTNKKARGPQPVQIKCKLHLFHIRCSAVAGSREYDRLYGALWLRRDSLVVPEVKSVTAWCILFATGTKTQTEASWCRASDGGVAGCFGSRECGAICEVLRHTHHKCSQPAFPDDPIEQEYDRALVPDSDFQFPTHMFSRQRESE